MHSDIDNDYRFNPEGKGVISDDQENIEKETPQKKRISFIIPLILFILTIFSTLYAGAVQQGADPIRDPNSLFKGVFFSFTLLLVLGTHELSHYFVSKIHGVQATLPYFIPAPSLVGTFGAFIKMRSPILNKRALIDIGISGPIGGFIVSLIAVIVGLNLSTTAQAGAYDGIRLGSPLIFEVLSRIIVGTPQEGYDILLHPIAFAGWIGLFVTSLNLIPIGQLDGGHIAFAIVGEKQRLISIVFIPVLLALGLFGWLGWIVWAFLISVLGVRHPPILDPEEPLDRRDRILGVTALIMFAVTFIPIPFSLF